MATKPLKSRPSECSVCHRPAHQHHCGVPTCKGCKTFFRRMYISKKIDKCQFDRKCFDDTIGGNIQHLRCQHCRFQKCIQVGMNPNDLRLPEADSLNSSATTFDNLPLLLKQLAHFGTYRALLLKTCSYDGDPTIEEISCMLQNLKFRKKQSCLTFPNGSDCFLSDAITVPADFENRIRCRLVGRLCDLKVTYDESLLISLIFISDPALNGLSEMGQSLISSHRNVYSSLLVQYCLQNYQKLGPSRFVDLLSIYDAIKKTQEDLKLHYLLCYLNNPPPKLYKIWLSIV